ncbi:unnamed protein product [Polarella glacialis]|uniref:C3H1-type domain-containing protein n=1 Tax=Polarella glacialis TaxID=89957 RepID=A0A813F923_POLGL|nr:unnamed protein product [Polarella glacialis]
MALAPPLSPGASDPGGDHREAFMRTKLCKFDLLGICTRGQLCTFAHGWQSLRTEPDLYRTRLCSHYLRSGRCEDGDACRYAHSSKELRAKGELEGEGIFSACATGGGSSGAGGSGGGGGGGGAGGRAQCQGVAEQPGRQRSASPGKQRSVKQRRKRQQAREVPQEPRPAPVPIQLQGRLEFQQQPSHLQPIKLHYVPLAALVPVEVGQRHEVGLPLGLQEVRQRRAEPVDVPNNNSSPDSSSPGLYQETQTSGMNGWSNGSPGMLQRKDSVSSSSLGQPFLERGHSGWIQQSTRACEEEDAEVSGQRKRSAVRRPSFPKGKSFEEVLTIPAYSYSVKNTFVDVDQKSMTPVAHLRRAKSAASRVGFYGQDGRCSSSDEGADFEAPRQAEEQLPVLLGSARNARGPLPSLPYSVKNTFLSFGEEPGVDKAAELRRVQSAGQVCRLKDLFHDLSSSSDEGL